MERSEPSVAVTEAELRELRRKFQLLEGDRKAYYETSMRNMKENKAMIAQLRHGTKELQSKLRATRKANAQAQAETDTDAEQLEKQVTVIRKNLDTVKATVAARREELERLRDSAQELTVAATRADPMQASPEQMRKIRSLENRLDRAIIKFNEAQNIRTTYEQIVSRLKDEKDQFDAQLTAIERTISSKSKDLEELRLLGMDAEAARESSAKELLQANNRLDRERKSREYDVKRKRQIVEAGSSVIATLENARSRRPSGFGQGQVSSAIGHGHDPHDGSGLGQLQSFLTPRQGEPGGTEALRQMEVIIAVAKPVRLDSEKEAKLDHFEAGFAKMMRLSGVQDVNEITNKILNQADAQKQLKELVAENAKSIEERQTMIQRLTQTISELRFSGVHNRGVATRKRVDETEDSLEAVRAQMQHRKERFDQLADILLNVQAGLKHLHSKIKVLRPADMRNIPISRDTLVESLEQASESLVAAYERVKNERGANEQLHRTASAGGETSFDLLRTPRESDETEVFIARPFNQRVRLREEPRRGRGAGKGGKAFALASPGESGGVAGEEAEEKDDVISIISYSSEEEGDDANDVNGPISRAHIKHASRILLSKRNKQHRRSSAGSVGGHAAPGSKSPRNGRTQKPRGTKRGK